MILTLIQQQLEKRKFESVLLPADDEFSDRLMVVLYVDKKKRNYILEIKAFELQISPESDPKGSLQFPCRIQFCVSLPFLIEDLALTQVASLILYLNPYLDLPGFELNELKGTVVYRYVWILQVSTFDPALLENIIGAIILNITLFPDIIESLADGQLTFNDLLANILEAINKANPNIVE